MLFRSLVIAMLLSPSEAKAEPYYCTALRLLDKSCISVNLMIKLYGEKNAEARARKCGATDEDIKKAKECKRPS